MKWYWVMLIFVVTIGYFGMFWTMSLSGSDISIIFFQDMTEVHPIYNVTTVHNITKFIDVMAPTYVMYSIPSNQSAEIQVGQSGEYTLNVYMQTDELRGHLENKRYPPQQGTFLLIGRDTFKLYPDKKPCVVEGKQFRCWVSSEGYNFTTIKWSSLDYPRIIEIFIDPVKP